MATQQKIKITKILSLAVSVAGIVVITGWIFDIGVLKSTSPGWVSMKLSTAFTFLLSGISLYFIARAREGKPDLAQLALSTASLIIVLIMGTLFFSSLLGVHTGVEELFIKEKGSPAQSVIPGLPSVPTMFNFLLMAFSGILVVLNVENLQKKLPITGFIIGSIGALAVFGYVINAPLLYYYIKDINSAMACHTAILFVLMGAGLVCLSG